MNVVSEAQEGCTLEFFELTLTIQDDRTVRARRENDAEVSGKLMLDDLRRDLIGIFDEWLSLGKMSRRREFTVFGSLLYRTLFNEQVESFFKQSLADARNARQRLRVQLSFGKEGADLASLPWEYLYTPEGYFLATHVDLVLARYIPLTTARESLAPAKGPLHILVVVSRPLDLGSVISDPVIEAIEKLSEVFPVTIDILNKPTIDNFLNKLEEVRPHVLHFIGHGQFNKDKKEGSIALLDEDEGSARWVRDYEFAQYFTNMRSIPRLAFLHLCEGGVTDLHDDFAGLAPHLVRAGIQAVVAMQYPISNNAAILFSQAFYRELAEGEPVDKAVQHGRWRITTRIPNAYDDRVFGTPVLYMRARDGIIQPQS